MNMQRRSIIAIYNGVLFWIFPSRRTQIAFQKILKCLSYFYVAVFNLSVLYLFVAGLRIFYYPSNTKLGFSYVFINIVSFTLWFSMVYQRRHLEQLITSLNSQCISNYLNRNHVLLLNSSVFVFCILTPILAVASAYLMDEIDKAIDFWSLEYKLEDKTHRRIVNVVGCYSFMTVFMQFPALIVLFMCFLISLQTFHLTYLNDYLKSMDYCFKMEKYVNVLKYYDFIEENIYFLKRTLSLPLLIALMHSYFNLYSVLSLVLKGGVETHILVEMGCNIFTGIVLLTSLTIFSSKIPDGMRKIKTTVAFLINKHEQINNLRKEKEIRILKRMEKKEIIYLSACDLIDFKKSFLLTAFGTLFTYGLLIVNLN